VGVRLLGLPNGYWATRWRPGGPVGHAEPSRTAQLQAAAATARPGALRLRALGCLALWCADAEPRLATGVSRTLLAEAAGHANPALPAYARYVHAVTTLCGDGEYTGPYRELTALRHQFLDLSRPVEAAWCDYMAAVALEYAGDPGGATVTVDRALAVFRAHRELAGEARCLNLLGYGESCLGRHEEAQARYRRAAELADLGGCPATASIARLNAAESCTDLGLGALAEHRIQVARQHFERAEVTLAALAITTGELGHRFLQPIVAACHGAALYHLGRHDEALEACDRALSLADETDSARATASARCFAGQVYLALGEPIRAAELLSAALAQFGARGFHLDTARTLRALVAAKEAAGDLAEAYALHKRLLAAELALRDANVQRENEVIAARVERSSGALSPPDAGARSAELVRQNTRLEAERRVLERLAHTDSLTGLANRRHFDAQLARLSIRAELSGRELSLLLVDIDRFKRINDQLSHVTGDTILARVAKAIAAHCTDRQLAARVGGEEFAVLLPGRGSAEATATADRIRGTVERLVLDDLAPGLRVTISAGVASAPPGGPVVGLFAAADAALYRAKQAGRNRVACA
jgi:diguanylate cyclase (GGDEF)-like protein